MDRIIVYPGAIPLDTDMLNTNRNVMVALHALISATLGTTTAVDGLAVQATTPASMQITVSAGSITQYGYLDANPYGSLPADLTDPLLKMAVLLDPTTFTLTAPTTPGTSVIFLVEGAFTETDQDPVVLPYYNAANPAMPYLGPGNSGAAQNTVRQQRVVVQVKAGTPSSGSPPVPVLDPGYVALAVVEVSAGATQVTQSNIFSDQTTRFTPWKLPDLTPGFAFSQAFTSTGTFIVPDTITRLRATLIGGGGAGGSCTSSSGTNAGGGGGAGGTGIVWLTGLTPGTEIAVTVGGSGLAAAGANGGPGGTSSFGSYCSATGGSGGTAGTSAGIGTGGAGGTAVGGGVYYPGSTGTDAVPGALRGGDGGGNGAGKGGSNTANGANAISWGGGGGGASGASSNGGSGGGGYVIVEW